MNIEIDNVNINYEVYGEGNPVIILHGWLANSETMKSIADNLSRNFKVYNVDVIGHGKSDLPAHPYSSDDFGNFLKEFVDKLNIENPILIGHSNGGRIILNCLGRNLIKAKKIILLDSAGIRAKKSLKKIIRIYTFKTGKKILNILPKNEKTDEMRNRLFNKFASSDYKNSPEIMRKTMSIILNEDMSKILKNIKVPTLLIWGDKDTATPIRDAKIIEKGIPDCGLVVYEGGSHFAFLEQLGRTFTIINEFLKNDK